MLGPIAGLGMTAGPAAALTCPPGTTAWEQTHYGELSGGGGEQPSVTTANNWGGGSACLTVPGSSYTYDAAFTVAQSAGSYTGNVLSDPDSNVGCEGGYCTSSDPLSGTIGSGPTYANPEIWWDYSLAYVNNSTSAYDEEINSNYSSEACTSTSDAPTDDTNLSIYVDADKDGSVGNAGYQGLGLPSSTHNTTTATIDGVSWYVLNIYHAGSTPSYKIEFSAVNVGTIRYANVTTVAHYKTVNRKHTGVANAMGNAKIGYSISGAAPGYRVNVSVTVTSGRSRGSCSTSFIPHR